MRSEEFEKRWHQIAYKNPNGTDAIRLDSKYSKFLKIECGGVRLEPIAHPNGGPQIFKIRNGFLYVLVRHPKFTTKPVLVTEEETDDGIEWLGVGNVVFVPEVPPGTEKK